MDFKEIDEIFDDLDSQASSSTSYLQTLVNIGMIAVIGASGYIWFKLNAHEHKYKWLVFTFKLFNINI